MIRAYFRMISGTGSFPERGSSARTMISVSMERGSGSKGEAISAPWTRNVSKTCARAGERTASHQRRHRIFFITIGIKRLQS